MPYQPGDILLDKYRIEALLGHGAFGEVYRVMRISLNVLYEMLIRWLA
jgi:serine/threonine protein kinase